MFLVPIGGRGRGKFCFGLRSWGIEKGRFPIFFFQINIREELFLFSRLLFYLPRHLAEFGARWLLWLLRYDVLLKRGQDILRFFVCLFILPFEQKKPINYPRK